MTTLKIKNVALAVVLLVGVSGQGMAAGFNVNAARERRDAQDNQMDGEKKKQFEGPQAKLLREKRLKAQKDAIKLARQADGKKGAAVEAANEGLASKKAKIAAEHLEAIKKLGDNPQAQQVKALEKAKAERLENAEVRHREIKENIGKMKPGAEGNIHADAYTPRPTPGLVKSAMNGAKRFFSNVADGARVTVAKTGAFFGSKRAKQYGAEVGLKISKKSEKRDAWKLVESDLAVEKALKEKQDKDNEQDGDSNDQKEELQRQRAAAQDKLNAAEAKRDAIKEEIKDKDASTEALQIKRQKSFGMGVFGAGVAVGTGFLINSIVTATASGTPTNQDLASEVDANAQASIDALTDAQSKEGGALPEVTVSGDATGSMEGAQTTVNTPTTATTTGAVK